MSAVNAIQSIDWWIGAQLELFYYISNESAFEYIAKSEQAFGKALSALDTIDRLSSEYKQLYFREFNRTGIAFTFKDAIKKDRDLLNDSLRELSNIRELIKN